MMAQAGVCVVLIEPDPQTAERVAVFLKQQSGTPAAPCRVETGFEAATQADFAFEAMQDDPEPRQKAYAALEKALPTGAVIAREEGTDDGFFQSHAMVQVVVFGPAHLRRLVEIIPARATSAHATERTKQVMEAVGRVPIVLPAGATSVGLHLLDQLHEAADTLLINGATPWDIDEAWVDFGFETGLYEAQDLVGLDQAYARRKAQAATRDPARPNVPVSDRMVHEGRLGKSVGVGWYRYPGGGGAVIDPLIEDLTREEAWFAKLTPRDFGADEIRHRLLMALINAAMEHLIELGEQIDQIARHGLGFPTAKGGLIAFADGLGAGYIYDSLKQLAAEDTVAWQPCPTIEYCALNRVTFADYVKMRSGF